jgi:hypothetical protein
MRKNMLELPRVVEATISTPALPLSQIFGHPALPSDREFGFRDKATRIQGPTCNCRVAWREFYV